jgi:peptidoglycan hydrolase FlgJ
MRPIDATAQSPEADLSRTRARLGKACEGFEAIFIRQMLATARSSSTGEGILGEGAATEITESMRDDALADAVSSGGGMGVADLLEKQLWPAVRAQALAAGRVRREG